MVENARAPRKIVENGFWSLRPFMDFAKAPRKKVENDIENGSGVPKPPYSFTFAKVENRLALNVNVCRGRTTRFRAQRFCLHPFHDPIWTLSNLFLASFGSQTHCSLATRTPREHSRSKHPCLGCLTRMMKWIFSVPTGRPGKCIVVVVSVRSRIL